VFAMAIGRESFVKHRCHFVASRILVSMEVLAQMTDVFVIETIRAKDVKHLVCVYVLFQILCLVFLTLF
jgi:hypothetical protein